MNAPQEAAPPPPWIVPYGRSIAAASSTPERSVWLVWRVRVLDDGGIVDGGWPLVAVLDDEADARRAAYSRHAADPANDYAVQRVTIGDARDESGFDGELWWASWRERLLEE